MSVRNRVNRDHAELDEAISQDWEDLYREAADEDRSLAEAGLCDHATVLARDVMLEPWCELPRPTPIGGIASRFVENLPFDIPEIPSADGE